VSTAEHPDGATLQVLAPEDALRRARPLPPRERLALEDVPPADWASFLDP